MGLKNVYFSALLKYIFKHSISLNFFFWLPDALHKASRSSTHTRCCCTLLHTAYRKGRHECAGHIAIGSLFPLLYQSCDTHEAGTQTHGLSASRCSLCTAHTMCSARAHCVPAAGAGAHIRASSRSRASKCISKRRSDRSPAPCAHIAGG